MSEESFEIVRDAVDAINRQDLDAALRHTAPDFVWDNSNAIGEQRGVYTTTDQLRDLMAWGADLWESMRFELDELIAVGDHVVAPHTTHVRGRDGIEVKARTTWLFTFRDGRIERVCLYQGLAEALEAARRTE